MSRHKLDFTGVEEFSMLEEGRYAAKVKSVEEKVAESSGNDMLVFTFDTGTGTVKDNMPLTQTALWKLKSALKAMGIKADGKLNLDTDKLVGKKCVIDVIHEEYNGKNYAKVSAYHTLAVLADTSNNGEEDDWDEEVEEEEVVEQKPKTKKKSVKATKPKKKPEPEPEEDDDDWDDWDEE